MFLFLTSRTLSLDGSLSFLSEAALHEILDALLAGLGSGAMPTGLPMRKHRKDAGAMATLLSSLPSSVSSFGWTLALACFLEGTTVFIGHAFD
jgi:hypothetical protein